MIFGFTSSPTSVVVVVVVAVVVFSLSVGFTFDFGDGVLFEDQEPEEEFREGGVVERVGVTAAPEGGVDAAPEEKVAPKSVRDDAESKLWSVFGLDGVWRELEGGGE